LPIRRAVIIVEPYTTTMVISVRMRWIGTATAIWISSLARAMEGGRCGSSNATISRIG